MGKAGEIVMAWVAAANSHDSGQLAALYSPNAQLLYAWGELLDGQNAIANHFDTFFRAFPTWEKKPYSLIQGHHDWAVLEWQASATFLGDYQNAEPTGRSFKIRGCGVFRVIEGRIALHRRYLDRLDWFKQMGIR